MFDDQFNDVALLAGGDVAATGSLSSATGQDALIARLSPTGQRRWQRTYDGPDGLADQGLFLAGGPKGALYVAGSSDGTATATDILTLKYSATGHLRWARRHAGTSNSMDFTQGLLVTKGRVYVAGSENGAVTETATLLAYVP